MMFLIFPPSHTYVKKINMFLIIRDLKFRTSIFFIYIIRCSAIIYFENAYLENVMRSIKSQSLKEQDEGNPLVVGLVMYLILSGIKLPNPRLSISRLLIRLRCPMFRKGKRRHYITIGVYHVQWDRPRIIWAFHHASNLLPSTNPFQTGDHQRASKKEDKGNTIMKFVTQSLGVRFS